MGSGLGSYLRDARRTQKLTLRHLAERTGIDYSMISKYENGIVTPPPEKLQIIAEALCIDADTLLSGDQILKFGTPLRRRIVVSNVDEDRFIISDSEATRDVLEIADGTCELCGTHFPDGPFFLEAHYIVWLRDGGKPSIDNVVALCPNCHKKIHLSTDPSDIEKLIAIAKRHML